MQIAVLTFDGFNELDSFVAAAILNRLRGQGWEAHITAPTPKVTSMNGVTIERQQPLDFAAKADAVIIGSSGLGRAAFDSFAELAKKEETAATPLLLLVDRQFTGLLAQLPGAPHRKALALPLNAGSLRKTLHALIRTRREKDRDGET